MEVHHPVAEAPLAEQLEPQAHAAGKAGVPPPTMTGAQSRWHSSTNPAARACAASPGPPTVMSRAAAALSSRIASASNARSMRVRALETSASVVE